MEIRWEPYHPSALATLLGHLDGPWWIAGGWALELYAGKYIRDHSDLDVEIPRNAADDLATVLQGWDLQLAQTGSLSPWTPGEPISLEVNSLWCRPDHREPWRLQVMLATTTADCWFYRRNPRIWREFVDVGFVTESGLPILAPEIQLLYKSSHVRSKDQLDFETVLGLLTKPQRDWLADALRQTSPGHVWLRKLRETSTSL